MRRRRHLFPDTKWETLDCKQVNLVSTTDETEVESTLRVIVRKTGEGLARNTQSATASQSR